MLVGNADQIMVGWRDPNGVGAIGSANQITNLPLVFSVVCTSSMILISQYIGAKDTRRVNETYAVSLLVNLIFGLAVNMVMCRTLQACGDIRFPITICVRALGRYGGRRVYPRGSLPHPLEKPRLE